MSIKDAINEWKDTPSDSSKQGTLLEELLAQIKEAYTQDTSKIENEEGSLGNNTEVIFNFGEDQLEDIESKNEAIIGDQHLTVFKKMLCLNLAKQLPSDNLEPLIENLKFMVNRLKEEEGKALLLKNQDANTLQFKREAAEQLHDLLYLLDTDPIGVIQADSELQSLESFAVEYCKFQIKAQELREYALTMPDSQKKTDALELADTQITYSRHALLGMLHDAYETDKKKHIGRARLKEMNTKCGTAFNSKLPSLETHRDSKIKRIAGNVLMGLATLVTAGLAAIAKISHSKLSTGLYTLFSSRPNSARHADSANDQRQAFYQAGMGLTAGAA